MVSSYCGYAFGAGIVEVNVAVKKREKVTGMMMDGYMVSSCVSQGEMMVTTGGERACSRDQTSLTDVFGKEGAIRPSSSYHLCQVEGVWQS